jgi:hypothetical protein
MVQASLVILAAGMGSRYGGPKQIEPVGPRGELLMEYSIYDALRVGFDRIALVIREDQEPIARKLLSPRLVDSDCLRFAHQRADDLPVATSPEVARDKPWGTAQAVYAARDLVHGPFAVINADDFYGRSSYQRMLEFLIDHPDAYGLVGFSLEKTLSPYGAVNRGICQVDRDGCLIELVERRNVRRVGRELVSGEDASRIVHPPASVASMNLWGFPVRFLEELERWLCSRLGAPSEQLMHEEFFLPAAVDEICRASGHCVHVLSTSEEWMGVTFREDLPRVRDAIHSKVADGEYPSRLWELRP